MGLIDIGVNLTSKQFRADRDDVVARAREAQVGGMIVTGTSLRGSQEALELSGQYEQTWCTAGVHPHDAKTWNTETHAKIKRLAQSGPVVAVGECGLDFNRNFSPPAEQRSAFAAQIEIAAETGLPIFLHQRDAHDEFLQTLKSAWSSLEGGAVVHCFTDGPTEAQDYLDLGCHLGITGWVTDARRGEELRRAVPLIPKDRLLIETDAPYLLPQNLRPKPKGRGCEPMHLIEVARSVARLREETLEDVMEYTTANARRFFRLPG